MMKLRAGTMDIDVAILAARAELAAGGTRSGPGRPAAWAAQ